jgi:hypothetical protein
MDLDRAVLVDGLETDALRLESPLDIGYVGELALVRGTILSVASSSGTTAGRPAGQGRMTLGRAKPAS